jgi:hypothetical protein
MLLGAVPRVVVEPVGRVPPVISIHHPVARHFRDDDAAATEAVTASPEVREPMRVGALEDPQYLAYHDEEWGVPVYDDRRLFEMLTLEGVTSTRGPDALAEA